MSGRPRASSVPRRSDIASAAEGSFRITREDRKLKSAPRSKSVPTGRPSSSTLTSVLRVHEAENLSRALTAVQTGDAATFEEVKAFNILLPFAFRTLHDAGRNIPQFNMLASLTNVVSQMLDPEGNVGVVTCLSAKLATELDEEGPVDEEPEEGEGKEDEAEPAGLRHAFSPTSTTSQCGNIVGKFVMNSSICWICGCIIGGLASAPAGSRLQLTAECEHVLPVAQAIAFTGLYDSTLAKQLENADGAAGTPEEAATRARYEAALGLEYGWAHVFCNQFKNNKHLIKDDAETFRVASVDVVREWLDEMINWTRRGNVGGVFMKQFVTAQYRALAESPVDPGRDTVIHQAFPGIATPQQRLPPRAAPYTDAEVYAAWLQERAEIVFARNSFIMNQPAIAGMTIDAHKYQFYLNVLSFIQERFPMCYELLNRLPKQRRGQDVRYDIVNNPIEIFVDWIRPKLVTNVCGSINAAIAEIPSMFINTQTKVSILTAIKDAEDNIRTMIGAITQGQYTEVLGKYATILNAKYGPVVAKPKFKGAQPMLIALMCMHAVSQRTPDYINSVVTVLPPRQQGNASLSMNDKVTAAFRATTLQIAYNLYFHDQGADPAGAPSIDAMMALITASPPTAGLVEELQRGGRRRTYRRGKRRSRIRRRWVPKLL